MVKPFLYCNNFNLPSKGAFSTRVYDTGMAIMISSCSSSSSDHVMTWWNYTQGCSPILRSKQKTIKRARVIHLPLADKLSKSKFCLIIAETTTSTSGEECAMVAHYVDEANVMRKTLQTFMRGTKWVLRILPVQLCLIFPYPVSKGFASNGQLP